MAAAKGRAGTTADGGRRRSSSSSQPRSRSETAPRRRSESGRRSDSGRRPGSRRRSDSRRHTGTGPLRAHWGRVGILILVLVAAGLYYAPLRDFFAQQDRQQKEAATLAELKRQNKAMEEQIAAMKSEAWLIREARSQFQLVPRGMQAFVVDGLPSDEELPKQEVQPVAQSLSWGDRLRDLFDTLLR